MRVALTTILLLSALPAAAQTGLSSVTTTDMGNDIPIAASPVQEKCITIMSGFPDNGHIPRYQFFKLTQELTTDIDPMMRSALDYFGDASVTQNTPVVEVIENIANPVFRQAAPEITIGNMAYLADFALDCETYLTGQIESLTAYDQSLTDPEFNIVIAEDALFMRQILSDSLFRIGAQDHEIFGPYVHNYASGLIRSRDEIEFAGFETELAMIENSYLSDLDGRLARSNDVINKELDQEALLIALEETEDLNNHARLESKSKMIQTLAMILGGG
ncbi:MAG: hypothetical protein HKN36_13175 [Hellea sp.]|nr:hypothetical protein [Hellea sp.]